MLRTIVLICSLSTDPSACTAETALDVAAFPPERGVVCGLSGQASIARTAIGPEPGKSYAKIVCERMASR